VQNLLKKHEVKDLPTPQDGDSKPDYIFSQVSNNSIEASWGLSRVFTEK
jgi:hypothetical protein